jgi:predicted amidohydrolase
MIAVVISEGLSYGHISYRVFTLYFTVWSMPRDTMKVLVAQKKHRRFDLDHNLGVIDEIVHNTISDMVIFPEMFLTGYNIGSEFFRLSQGPSSGAVQRLEDLSKETGKYLIVGMPEKSRDIRGQIHNSAGIFGPDGLIGFYRKMHLVDFGPFEEWAYFTPGREPFMFEIEEFRIGVIICYDIFFPELTKYYAVNGADAVVCISASPSVTRRFFETTMASRAVENTIYFIYSNLVGFDARMEFWGGGSVIGPRGEEVVKGPYFEEALLTAELKLHTVEASRRLRPTLRDTRRDILEMLASGRKGMNP